MSQPFFGANGDAPLLIASSGHARVRTPVPYNSTFFTDLQQTSNQILIEQVISREHNELGCRSNEEEENNTRKAFEKTAGLELHDEHAKPCN